MLMELIGKKIRTEDVLGNMTYADDMDITAENKHEKPLQMWKEVFEKHCLRMSRAKTQVMWVRDSRGRS